MNEITVYEQKAKSITISTPKDLEEAASLLNELNVFKDKLTKKKNEVMRPLLDAVAAERARWSPTEHKLTEFITELRGKITTYQTAETKRAAVEEAKITTKMEKGKLSLNTAVKKMTEIERPESTIETGAGTLKFRTVKKWRVSDIKKVPLKYLIVDDHQVNQARKTNTPIPGIEYYEEQVPASYRA